MVKTCQFTEGFVANPNNPFYCYKLLDGLANISQAISQCDALKSKLLYFPTGNEVDGFIDLLTWGMVI